ncbi:methyl-accepting chemotaxis protein [Aquibium sp. ELW1220]|uniref:methyl-accepting chemotaxis protein n=1 Tax=Aquibium sp. ELW1220 TaxID=2976766 RepID=UPI0025B24F68|nr:methyl-accepting chemotaxis protein [Aquibium sp. ELW1220]MDN2581693.1 methyl-accepting chemotaxis protein [Aquibium sp. ELW1220]
MTLSLKAKFALSFGLLLLLTAALGGVSIMKMSTINDASTVIAENWLPSVDAVHTVNTDTSDFRILEYRHVATIDPAGMAQVEADLDVQLKKLVENRAKYEALISSPKERALYDRFSEKFEEYMKNHERMISSSRQNQNEVAANMLRQSSALYSDFSNDLVALVNLNRDSGKSASDDATVDYNNARTIVLSMIAVSILLGVGVAVIVSRGILKQLGGEPDYTVSVIKEISAGNLGVEVMTSKGDNTSLLAAARDMVAKLKEVVSEVTTATRNVASGSQEMSASSEQLSQGATEQASSTEEASSSMEEMAANIKQSADNAMQTEKIARQSALDAQASGEAVGKAVDAMQTIAQKILIVQEIARQTDLLALNAAVEAARAGEHGRGFAVVASEVRKLAERSQAAAQEISGLSGDTVKAAQEAGEMLTRLVPDIQKTAELVSEISNASREQNAGAAQVNAAIQQLDKVTQQNTSAAEELSSTSEELASQAEQLEQVISYFRLDQSSPAGHAAKPVAVRASLKGRKMGVAEMHTALRSAAPKLGGTKAKTKGNGGGFALDLEGDEDELDRQFMRNSAA